MDVRCIRCGKTPEQLPEYAQASQRALRLHRLLSRAGDAVEPARLAGAVTPVDQRSGTMAGMTSPQDHVEVFRDDEEQYGWRRVGPDGKTARLSSVGFIERADALTSARNYNRDVEDIRDVVEDSEDSEDPEDPEDTADPTQESADTAHSSESVSASSAASGE